MPVITISRQIGSGGRELGARLCELLDLRLLDKEMMANLASELGLGACEVVDFSEENYRVRSLLDRLLRRGPGAMTTPPKTSAAAVQGVTIQQLNEARCLAFVRGTVLAAFERGNVVIIGRGGQAILKDMPDALHVRLEAPEGSRIRRIQDRYGVSFAQAYQLMADRDRATEQYLDEFFGVRWNDPSLYHLVINTGKLDIEAAAQAVAAAVRRMPAATPPEVREESRAG